MSVAVVTSAAAHIDQATNTASFSVAIPPAGQEAGYLALVTAGSNSGLSTLTPDASWTVLAGPKVSASNVQSTYLLAKILEAGDVACTGAWSSAGKLHGSLLVLAGAKMPDPADVVHVFDNTLGATVAAGSVDVTVAESMAVGMALLRGTTATAKFGSSVSAGWTERVDNGTAFATAPNFAAAVATKVVDTPATVTGPTWTSSDASSTGQAYLLAIEPETAGLQGMEGWVNLNGVYQRINSGSINWNGAYI